MSAQQNALPRGNACLTCRKKKQKCDGTRPTCHGCEKSGRECVYNDSVKSKAQLLAERINDIESKIVYMETGSSSGNSSRGKSTPPSNPSSGATAESMSRTSSIGSSRGGSPAIRAGSVVPGARLVWNADPHAPHPAFTEEIPRRLLGNLTETFLQNRDKCCMEFHESRFRATLALPPTDVRAPHPAFVQAVMLIGCYFSRSPSLTDYEIRFLAQTRRELATSFAGADRLHDFVRASNLVAFYYFSKGMNLEAYQQIAASAHMAVSCRLHQIPSSAWRPPSRPEAADQFLSHSADAVDLGERIHTFWQTVYFDKIISMVAGQPSQLPTGSTGDLSMVIMTPWPRQIKEYETGKVSDADNQTIANLFNPRGGEPVRPETVTTLRVQGICLVEQAIQLSQTHSNAQAVQNLSAAIQSHHARLPRLHDTAQDQQALMLNTRMVLLHILSHVASLILFQHGADPNARHKCGVATQGMTNVIAELTEPDWAELVLEIGYLWFFVCEILVSIFHASHGPTKEQVNRDLTTIMSALRTLSKVYPPLGFQLHQLEQMLHQRPARSG